jgi:hypothetical protein
MDVLIIANRDAIFKKLARLRVVEESICCNDLIDAISTSVSRDKRLINSYNISEMTRRKIMVHGTLRMCRMFTMAGIARYIQEGKVYGYENVCEYFGIVPINPLLTEMYNCLNKKDLFITQKVLKWVFGKRKQTNELGVTVSHLELVEWLKNYTDKIADDKYKLITEIEYE